jgi:DNA-binding NtrC family response regulator
MNRTLLVVDDEQDMRQLLKRSLEPDLNCRVDAVADGETALKMIKQQSYDLILADIRMPGMSGLELLVLIKRQLPDQTVVMMTGHGRIDTAVEAMKRGAYDFITKPFDHDTLLVRLEKAMERATLLSENRRLQQECRRSDAFEDMVGNSPVMKRVYESIRTVAQTDLTVLITGESGVGKDLTARAVHSLSHRRNGPFVAVNCPTVPEQILESELFGYKKGAFTHATQNKSGLFQEANRGTLFLDEIGDVSPTIQTKLLRVLQEKTIKPLGDTKAINIDVRIVASTNQKLDQKIARNEFREDFFYRLNVLPIKLPALREHPQDIALIANHLLVKHCRQLEKPIKKLSAELLEAFKQHEWTGNVREMENLILQGIIFSSADEIRPQDVGLQGAATVSNLTENAWSDLPYRQAKEKVLQRFNASYINRLLEKTGGNVTQAAKACGLERQTLQQIMRRFDLKADQYRRKSLSNTP